MSTLTEIVRTAATKTEKEYRDEVNQYRKNRDAEMARREELLPGERAQLTSIPDEPVRPGITIKGVYYPKISAEFIGAARKKIKGVVLPAFAVHDLFEKNSDDVRTVDYDGEMRGNDTGSMHYIRRADEAARGAKPGSYRGAHRAALSQEHPIIGFIVTKGLQTCGVLVGMSTYFGMMHLWGWLIACGVMAIATGITWIAVTQDSSFGAHKSYVIRHKFSGIIPDEIRKKAKELRNVQVPGVYRARVLIVREAYDWGFESLPPDPDPLLILEVDGEWYLADKFDLTPVERWALEGVEG